MPLPAPTALLPGGRCRPQRPWGSSSLPPYQKKPPTEKGQGNSCTAPAGAEEARQKSEEEGMNSYLCPAPGTPSCKPATSTARAPEGVRVGTGAHMVSRAEATHRQQWRTRSKMCAAQRPPLPDPAAAQALSVPHACLHRGGLPLGRRAAELVQPLQRCAHTSSLLPQHTHPLPLCTSFASGKPGLVSRVQPGGRPAGAGEAVPSGSAGLSAPGPPRGHTCACSCWVKAKGSSAVALQHCSSLQHCLQYRLPQ